MLKGAKMELNREQLIKAWECCKDNGGECPKDCPLYGDTECTQTLGFYGLSLVHKLTTKTETQDIVIAELRKLLEKANHDADRYAVKIKELTEANEQYQTENMVLSGQVERLKVAGQEYEADAFATIEMLTKDKEWSAKRIIEADKKVAKLTEENERLNGKVAEYEEERKYHFEMSRKRIAEAEAKANAQAVRIECLEEENNQLKADICNAHMNLEHITEDNEAQYQTINNLLKTIEDVQGVKSEYETFIGGMKSQIDKIKAEVTAATVKRMQVLLHKKANYKVCGYYCVSTDDIDEIAKKVIGGAE
jgi:chromosome segregation ATPase